MWFLMDIFSYAYKQFITQLTAQVISAVLYQTGILGWGGRVSDGVLACELSISIMFVTSSK
jgi:hypothetical protein